MIGQIVGFALKVVGAVTVTALAAAVADQKLREINPAYRKMRNGMDRSEFEAHLKRLDNECPAVVVDAISEDDDDDERPYFPHPFEPGFPGEEDDCLDEDEDEDDISRLVDGACDWHHPDNPPHPETREEKRKRRIAGYAEEKKREKAS